MSVWTRVQTKVLEEKVEMDLFKEAIKDLNLTLDFTCKQIDNAFGKSDVYATLKYKGRKTALGIVLNSKEGIDLVGDTWQSGIVGDNQHEKLVNMISQVYQSHKLKRDLELAGWDIVTTKRDNKIELEITQW